MDWQSHEDQQRSRTYSAPNQLPYHAHSLFEEPVFTNSDEDAMYSQQPMDMDLTARTSQTDDHSWASGFKSSDLDSGHTMLPVSGWPSHSINQNLNAESWNPFWVGPRASFSAGIPVTPRPDVRLLSPTATNDSGYVSQPMRPQPSTVRSCPAEVDPRLTVPFSGVFSPTQSESQSRRGRGKGHRMSRAPSSARSSRIDQDLPLCLDCLAKGIERKPKNRSEQKKHEKVHTKPYSCNEGSCGADKKFAAWNDLERHQRAKHGIESRHGSCKYYKCKSPNCSKADKIWERKDNFKAHFERTHKGSSKQELDVWVANSEYQPTEEESLVHRRQKEKRRPQDDSRSDIGANERSYFDTSAEKNYQNSSTSQSVPPDDPLSQGELPFFKNWSDKASEIPDLYLGQQVEELTANMHPSKDESVTMALSGLGSGSNQAAPIPTVADDFCHLKIGAMAHQPTDKRAWSSMLNDNQVEAEQLCSKANGTCSEWASGVNTKRTKSDITGSSPDATFKCPECHKTKQRSCDLTKHMKRHTKPYGCTFPKCRKRFGSKNDWKRHESSQHKQQEMWRCNSEPCKASQPARSFYDKGFSEEHLEEHFKNDHACAIDRQTDYVSAFKLSKDYHETFWCGFCREIIAQDPKKETPADSGRFQHIGKHFDEDQDSSTEDWLCFEMNMLKRDVSDPPGKPKAPKSERFAGSPPKAKQEGCLTSMLAGPRKRPNSEPENLHGASSKKHCRDVESTS